VTSAQIEQCSLIPAVCVAPSVWDRQHPCNCAGTSMHACCIRVSFTRAIHCCGYHLTASAACMCCLICLQPQCTLLQSWTAMLVVCGHATSDCQCCSWNTGSSVFTQVCCCGGNETRFNANPGCVKLNTVVVDRGFFETGVSGTLPASWGNMTSLTTLCALYACLWILVAEW
jgi:hypothetical protein